MYREVYEKFGGVKFDFASLAPWGHFPTIKALKQDRKGGCLNEVTLPVKLHDGALTKAVEEVQKQLQGLKYSDFNLYSTLSKRIKYPSKYGMYLPLPTDFFLYNFGPILICKL